MFILRTPLIIFNHHFVLQRETDVDAKQRQEARQVRELRTQVIREETEKVSCVQYPCKYTTMHCIAFCVRPLVPAPI